MPRTEWCCFVLKLVAFVVCTCLWYARGLRLCPCVITPRGFTSLPTGGGVWFFGFYSNQQTNKQTKKRPSSLVCLYSKGFWFEPREAKWRFSGFLPTNKQQTKGQKQADCERLIWVLADMRSEIWPSQISWVLYNPIPRRWDSKCCLKCISKSSMVRVQVKWALWKETCYDHRGFRFAFRWPFRLFSFLSFLGFEDPT